MIDKIIKYIYNNKIIIKVIYFTLLIYTVFRILFYFNLEEGCGDEFYFVKEIDFLKNNGLLEGLKKGISILHIILVYPFSLIFENYIALRVFNFLITIPFILYYFSYFKTKRLLIYFVFFTITASSFFVGTNDALFQILLTIFFIESFLILFNKKNNPTLMLSCLVLAFFSREMILVYLPVIFILLFFNFKFINKKHLILPLFIFIIFLVLNLPSILTNKKLCYDNKTPNNELNVNWTERQYLSQLMVNEGKLKNFNHATWEEVYKYKLDKGENSLPKTSIDAIFFDINLTFKEFFKDFFYMLKDSLRQIGFTQIFLFLILFISLINYKRIENKYYVIPFITFLSYCIFAFFIISYVEMRWLVPIGYLSIFYLLYLQKDITKKIKISKIYYINDGVIFLMILYGIIKSSMNYF